MFYQNPKDDHQISDTMKQIIKMNYIECENK